MTKDYFSVNIRDLMLDEAGKCELSRLTSEFSCPPNSEIEHFLRHNAEDFTRKNQSVTYLVLKKNSVSFPLMGYFTLTIKPISVPASVISKTMGKKLSRVSALNPESDTYTAAAYLIAQLGKNFSWPKEDRITGVELLSLASLRISQTQHDIGGVVEFLECEDNPFLLDFYAENGFKAFDRRTATPSDNESPHELVQLLRFL